MFIWVSPPLCTASGQGLVSSRHFLSSSTLPTGRGAELSSRTLVLLPSSFAPSFEEGCGDSADPVTVLPTLLFLENHVQPLEDVL